MFFHVNTLQHSRQDGFSHVWFKNWLFVTTWVILDQKPKPKWRTHLEQNRPLRTKLHTTMAFLPRLLKMAVFILYIPDNVHEKWCKATKFVSTQPASPTQRHRVARFMIWEDFLPLIARHTFSKPTSHHMWPSHLRCWAVFCKGRVLQVASFRLTAKTQQQIEHRNPTDADYINVTFPQTCLWCLPAMDWMGGGGDGGGRMVWEARFLSW